MNSGSILPLSKLFSYSWILAAKLNHLVSHLGLALRLIYG